MLETLSEFAFDDQIFRLANPRNLGQFLRDFDARDAAEIGEFMGFAEVADLTDLLDSPFTRKSFLAPPRNFGTPTRFSDGSYPVFYGALEEATAKAEVTHHYAREARGDLSTARTLYYTLFHCRFAGNVVDLQQQTHVWPDLVSDLTDNPFCQSLGAEGKARGLDGFLAPSARAPLGTTVPVFSRPSLADPAPDGVVEFSFDAAANDPVVTHIT